MKTKSIFGKLGMFLSSILLCSQMYGQVCTPNGMYTQSGIWPAAPSNMTDGYTGVAYGFTYTLNIPADTVILGQNCTVDSLLVTNVTPLPAGLTYQCNPTSCHYIGGTSGCLQIIGTPTTAGSTTNINIQTNIYVTHPMFGSMSVPQNFGTYSVNIISSSASVENNITAQWSLFPNPAINEITISLGDMNESATVSVYDLSGRMLSSQNLMNNMDKLDLTSFETGTYLIQVTNSTSSKTFKILKK